MDLLATVRKEGSRGGASDFKWTDVQNSSRREHYLGHSLMAPVGRWQKGRDLNWYTKDNTDEGDEESAGDKAARERREEIRRVKEAEEDALARALGLPVAPRNNANMEPLGDKREVDKVLEEANGNNGEGGKGIGFGSLASRTGEQILDERIEGNAETQDKELQYALKEYRRRHHDGERRRRSRSRDRERQDRHSHRDRDRGRDQEDRRRRRKHRSRSRERQHRREGRSPRPRSRSRSRSPERHRDSYHRQRDRSPFPSHRRSRNDRDDYRDREEHREASRS